MQTQRREAFMAAYNHIKDGINSIYKDLTKSRVRKASALLTFALLVSGVADPWAGVACFLKAWLLGITSANLRRVCRVPALFWNV